MVNFNYDRSLNVFETSLLGKIQKSCHVINMHFKILSPETMSQFSLELHIIMCDMLFGIEIFVKR